MNDKMPKICELVQAHKIGQVLFALAVANYYVASLLASGFQYPKDELSTEDKITLRIIESYLDFKVHRKPFTGSMKLIPEMLVYQQRPVLFLPFSLLSPLFSSSPSPRQGRCGTRWRGSWRRRG